MNGSRTSSATRRWARQVGGTAMLAVTMASAGTAQRVDTIVAGTRRFALPPLGVDTVDGFSVHGDSARPMFSSTRSVTRQADGTLLAVSTFSTVVYTSVLDAATFAPIRTRTRAKTDSADMDFTATGVRGWSDAAHNVPRKTLDMQFGENPRPFESAARDLLAQVLPLAPGYVAMIPAIDAFEGKTVWWQLKVVGSDTLTYRGVRTPCWVVEFSVPANPAAVVHRKFFAKSDRRLLEDRNMRVMPDGSQTVSRLRGE